MGRLILVTGANGFVGRHLVARLLADGKDEVLASDLQPEPAPEIRSDRLRYLQADFSDAAQALAISAERPLTAVIHLAGATLKGDAPQERRILLAANVASTSNALELAARDNAHFLLPSTGLVYGDRPGPFREDMAPNPEGFYAFSKWMAETLVRRYTERYGVAGLILRLSVVYGEGQPEGMFLPSLLRALFEKRRMPMTAGAQKRDFLHVEDLAEAMAQAVGARLQGCYNVASGAPVTLSHAADLAEGLSGARGLVDRGALPYRPGESMDYSLAIGAIRNDLGWSPRIGLETGLERCWKHLEGKTP